MNRFDFLLKIVIKILEFVPCSGYMRFWVSRQLIQPKGHYYFFLNGSCRQLKKLHVSPGPTHPF